MKVIYWIVTVQKAIQTYKYLLKHGISSHITILSETPVSNVSTTFGDGVRKESTAYFVITQSPEMKTFAIQKVKRSLKLKMHTSIDSFILPAVAYYWLFCGYLCLYGQEWQTETSWQYQAFLAFEHKNLSLLDLDWTPYWGGIQGWCKNWKKVFCLVVPK